MCSLRLRDALIDPLAAGKTFAHAVPVSDGFFSQFPAEQNRAAFDFAGEVEQADIEVFDLHADGVDFGERIFDFLHCFLALRFAAGKMDNVKERAAVEKNAMGDGLKFSIDGLDQFFTVNTGTEKRFEDR